MKPIVENIINYKSAKAVANNFVEENPEVLTDRIKEIFCETIGHLARNYDYFGNTFDTELVTNEKELMIMSVKVAMPLEGTKLFMKTHTQYNLSHEYNKDKNKRIWMVSEFNHRQKYITDRTTFSDCLTYGVDLVFTKISTLDAFVAFHYKR